MPRRHADREHDVELMLRDGLHQDGVPLDAHLHHHERIQRREPGEHHPGLERTPTMSRLSASVTSVAAGSTPMKTGGEESVDSSQSITTPVRASASNRTVVGIVLDVAGRRMTRK